jgi:hypothetical protein
MAMFGLEDDTVARDVMPNFGAARAGFRGAE